MFLRTAVSCACRGRLVKYVGLQKGGETQEISHVLSKYKRSTGVVKNYAEGDMYDEKII